MSAPNPTITPTALDRILAIQFTIAWAGEGPGEPPQLGWWAITLTDPDGGGNFLKRLLPRTHEWAALVAMREAARRADERARRKMANPDTLMTLFHFGFEWDEALRERFDHHKRELKPPKSAFDVAYAVREPFDRAAFEQHLVRLAGKVAYEVVPGGRQISGGLAQADEAAVRLAGALVPLTPAYPLPFYVRHKGT